MCVYQCIQLLLILINDFHEDFHRGYLLKYISPTSYERQLISVLQPLPSNKTVHLLSRYTPSYVKPVIDSVFLQQQSMITISILFHSYRKFTVYIVYLLNIKY